MRSCVQDFFQAGSAVAAGAGLDGAHGSSTAYDDWYSMSYMDCDFPGARFLADEVTGG